MIVCLEEAVTFFAAEEGAAAVSAEGAEEKSGAESTENLSNHRVLI